MSTNRRAKSTTAVDPNVSRTGYRFGRWYRSRPLIGGILIVFAGLEMIFSGQLDIGSIHIQVGIEGMQAMILPVALATLGVLIIAMPVHRIFYGVMSLVISIYALVGVNLGGFLIGTVVGIVGGIMCVSWAPKRIPAVDFRGLADDEAPGNPAAPESVLAVDSFTEPPPFRSAPGAAGAAKGFAIVAMLLLACASATSLASTASFADTPTPSATADPSPSASADPTPTPSATAEPLPDDPLPAGPGPASMPPAPTPPKPAAPHVRLNAAPATDPPSDADAPLAAIPLARLRSSAVTLAGARYVGTVGVALAGGSTATVLKITADRVAMGGFALDSADPAARILATTASTLILGGPVTIYCTSLAGILADGSTVTFDLTSPPPVGVALPSLENATIALVAVMSGTAALAGAVETVR